MKDLEKQYLREQIRRAGSPAPTRKSAGIRLAVMDMWKAFRNSTERHAPQAAILFDKFYVNPAYLLKEQFGHLWSYGREGWARRFFETWRASLKWQRLKPYEKFAAMIERHWDGLAAYCRPENPACSHRYDFDYAITISPTRSPEEPK